MSVEIFVIALRRRVAIALACARVRFAVPFAPMGWDVVVHGALSHKIRIANGKATTGKLTATDRKRADAVLEAATEALIDEAPALARLIDSGPTWAETQRA
jgi:hypothetical protein